MGEWRLTRVLEFVAEDTEGIDRGGFAPENERAERHGVKPVDLSGAQLGWRKISSGPTSQRTFLVAGRAWQKNSSRRV